MKAGKVTLPKHLGKVCKHLHKLKPEIQLQPNLALVLASKQYKKEKYIVENQQSLTADHFILKNLTVANLQFLK